MYYLQGAKATARQSRRSNRTFSTGEHGFDMDVVTVSLEKLFFTLINLN
jgi:hypothetical protein